jgi:hypothetical protein
METKLIELSAPEMLCISGGNAYSLGRRFGRYCADCIDFYHGILVGFGILKDV